MQSLLEAAPVECGLVSKIPNLCIFRKAAPEHKFVTEVTYRHEGHKTIIGREPEYKKEVASANCWKTRS